MLFLLNNEEKFNFSKLEITKLFIRDYKNNLKICGAGWNN